MTTRCQDDIHCRHIRWGMTVRCCYCDFEPDNPLTDDERQRRNSGIVDAFDGAMDE